MRVLCVGDIHGSLRALEQVLDRCSYDPDNDKIIFLGDYVDGWSESSELIEYLIDLNSKSTHGHIFLRGNHDSWCQSWLVMGKNNPIWFVNGGKSTIESYIRTNYLTDERHKDFFKNLVNYYIDDQNRGFVHGGFNSKNGLGFEEYESDYYFDRDLWSLALLQDGKSQDASKEALSKMRRFDKHKEIYIGHTPTINWKIKPTYPEYKDDRQAKNGDISVPMVRCNVFNLDTGAGFSGKLSIMDIDTKEFWQSDLVSELYPNERGRN